MRVMQARDLWRSIPYPIDCETINPTMPLPTATEKLGVRCSESLRLTWSFLSLKLDRRQWYNSTIQIDTIDRVMYDFRSSVQNLAHVN